MKDVWDYTTMGKRKGAGLVMERFFTCFDEWRVTKEEED